EQELAQQRAGVVRRQPGGALRRLDDRAERAQLLGVLGEQPELEVVAAADLAAVELAQPRQRADQRRLAGAVGADQRHVLAELEPELEADQQRARVVGRAQQAVLDLVDDAAGALGRLEREAEALAVARVARQPVDLVELLLARLRLLGARAGAEAVD